MIPQWGTVAYLIHKDAINDIISSFPISTNMDYIYNKNIENFNSLCFVDSIFVILSICVDCCAPILYL